EQLFADANGVRDALYGSYYLTAAFYQSQYGIFGDLRGDDVVRVTGGSDPYMLNEYQYNYDEDHQSGATMAIWSDGYAVLNHVNNVINAADEIAGASSWTQELRAYKGQALALRALTFLVLSNVYAQHYTFTDDASHLRSEEHTSELQSRENLVCRLLLE